MINAHKLQPCLFFLVFLNCCLILCLTSVSLSTSHWVVVRPYRKFPPSSTTKKAAHSESTPIISTFDSDELYYAALSNALEEDEALLPFDLHALKDCKRYTGKIRFGLFKGVWLLNYAYGCKNRINHVSSNMS